MDNIEFLRKRTGRDERVCTDALEGAQTFVLAYTNRKKLIPVLERSVRELALIALNRAGTEGESARTEGGESYTFEDVPKHVYDILNRYRLARIGGKTYEAKADQNAGVLSEEKEDNKG